MERYAVFMNSNAQHIKYINYFKFARKFDTISMKT